MNSTCRFLLVAALGGLGLSSCVYDDPYGPYGYAGSPVPVSSGVAYYDTGYVGYPRYSGYDYGYGYGYGSGYYPRYSSFSLGLFGGNYYGYPYYSRNYRDSHHHHHYDSNSRTRTFRGAPLSSSAPTTPSFSAPRQLPRTSPLRSSPAPQLTRPSIPSSRVAPSMPRMTRPSAPSPRSAPMPSPSRRSRETTTAAAAQSSAAMSASIAAERRRSR